MVVEHPGFCQAVAGHRTFRLTNVPVGAIESNSIILVGQL
jgi:hypothetical protein